MIIISTAINTLTSRPITHVVHRQLTVNESFQSAYLRLPSIIGIEVGSSLSARAAAVSGVLRASAKTAFGHLESYIDWSWYTSGKYADEPTVAVYTKQNRIVVYKIFREHKYQQFDAYTIGRRIRNKILKMYGVLYIDCTY